MLSVVNWIFPQFQPKKLFSVSSVVAFRSCLLQLPSLRPHGDGRADVSEIAQFRPDSVSGEMKSTISLTSPMSQISLGSWSDSLDKRDKPDRL